jgi:hypothetical protein
MRYTKNQNFLIKKSYEAFEDKSKKKILDEKFDFETEKNQLLKENSSDSLYKLGLMYEYRYYNPKKKGNYKEHINIIN